MTLEEEQTQEKTKVMNHFAQSGKIERKYIHSKNGWDDELSPTWDWPLITYRIKKIKTEREDTAKEMSINDWIKGEDYSSTTQSTAIAGIHIADHYNAIEFYAETLELAQERRDFVLSMREGKEVSYPNMRGTCKGDDNDARILLYIEKNYTIYKKVDKL